MRLNRYINEELQQPTQEMIDFYEKRTKGHIDRVRKNLYNITEKMDDLNKVELMARAKEHDKSKYSKEEYIPYIWITWYHKEKKNGFEYPSGIEKITEGAWKHHKKVNSHHPEHYNKPSDMSNEDIAEMVADWMAMSQEFDNSLKLWADKNVGGKWKFNTDQVKLIYNIIYRVKRG